MFLCSAIAGLLLGAVTKAAPTEKDPLALSDPQHLQWFKEAKFGMFVHWGLYSLLGGSYQGKTMPDHSRPEGESWYAAWIQTRLHVPDDEYRGLMKQFNPTHFDAEQWISEAERAGMKYFVITSKHHDGFALWDSEVSTYDVMSTPFRRDILKELADACKRHGLKFGLYYSHWQDWEHPHGAVPAWYSSEGRNFEVYWREKCLPQVQELIKRYDPDLLWFDTWGEEGQDITPERRDELIALVRRLSPKCLINGRIRYIGPGDHIDFLEMMDNGYPATALSRPWQTPATMYNAWAWHAHDFNWKPTRQMLGYLTSNASKGGNYLLNIGPKPDGSIPRPSIRRLREMGAWLAANGEAVYGTGPASVQLLTPQVVATQRTTDCGVNLYLCISGTPKTIQLRCPQGMNPGKCSVLESGMPITYAQDPQGILTLAIPTALYNDPTIQVVKLEMNVQR